ncbi:MAG: MFS transporter [Anaerolineales bacterium]|nr:MFS transporter [Chloroflexota bacterium]MBL6982459.1 MFS transporter [Anaerolineales bacterium]
MKENTKSKGMLTFTIVWIGQLISTLGSGLTSFALGIWIYQETGSATLFVINILVWTLPNILISPVVGVISDRWDRRIVMIMGDSGAGLSSLFVILVLFLGDLQVWHIYVATAVNSAFGAFQWPAFSAATSTLVPKKQLGRAAGMSQIGDAVSHFATPAIAGALYVSLGMKFILSVDMVTYLFALGTLLAVRFPRPKTSEEGQSQQGSFWTEALFGWKYIKARPGLLGLLSVFATLNFLWSLTFPLLIPMLLNMTTPDRVGLIESIGGLGMLISTLVMSAWGGPKRRILGIFIAESLSGVAAIFLGLRPSVVMIAAALFGMHLVFPTSNANSQAIWQSKVAQDVQGRVFAIRRMIAFSIEPIAVILAGPLAERIFEPLMMEGGGLAGIFGGLLGVGPGRGIGLMFVLVGMVYVLASSVIVIHPRIRRVEVELEDVVVS